MTHTLDPIQGLIDYVNEIKPFHTKILEVAVAYAQNDDVDIIFTEEFTIDVSLFWPALADDDDVPIRNCPEGWGEVYDRPSQYIVVDANISPQTVSLDGDHTDVFDVGVCFEVREPVSEAVGSPITFNTPRVATMQATSVVYDSSTNTTVIGAIVKSEDWLGSPIVWFGSPSVALVEVVVAYLAQGEEWIHPTSTVDAEFVLNPGGSPPADIDMIHTNVGANEPLPITIPYFTYLYDSSLYSENKFYWESQIIDYGAPNSGYGPVIGVGEVTNLDINPPGQVDTRVVAYDRNPGTINTGGSPSTITGVGAVFGDVVNFALDYDNQKVWIGINGTWRGPGTQDPATGQGGYWPVDYETNSVVSNGTSYTPQFTPYAILQGAWGGFGPAHLRWRFSESSWTSSAPTGFERPFHLHQSGQSGLGGSPIIPEWTDIWTTPKVSRQVERGVFLARSSSSIAESLYRLQQGTSGKRYAEVTAYGNQADNGREIGLTTLDFSSSTIVSSTGEAIGASQTGQIRSRNVVDPGNYITLGSPNYIASLDGRAGASWGPGDTFMIATDYVNQRVYFGANGTWFENQDPTNPAHGAPFPTLTGSPNSPWYLTFRNENSRSTDYVNTGGALFRFPIPSGYAPYSGLSVAGSPLTAPSGSPPFGSNDFWVPPYPLGSVSSGDAFIIHDVVETKKLVIRTRPNLYYGSPVGGPGSPKIQELPPPGSPGIYGSPAKLYGSPWAPLYGSPNNAGNTITIKGITVDEFNYGTEVQIRNASEPALNKTYNVLTAVDLGGSPELIQLTMIDPIFANTTNDGELVLTPIGFSGGSFCSDIPPELAVTHWMEDVDMTWRFLPDESGGGVMLPAFQHFILEADAAANTIVVQGDTRYILNEFGSPIGGSPTSIPASIQHNVAAGSPSTPTANNTTVVISDIVYDVGTNTSTLQLDTVSVSTPTGWIVPVLPSPLPAGILALGSSALNPFLYYSADGVTTWNTISTMTGGSPSIDLGYGLQYMANLEQWVVLARDTTNSATEVWTTADTDPDDSTRWTRVFSSTTGIQAGGMKYANGRLVITAWTGSVWYTDDLVSFTLTGFASGNVFFRVGYGGVGSWGTGFWCISGGNGDGAYSVDNGQTWTQWATIIGAGYSAYALECGDEVGGSGYPRIVAGVESNNSIYTSDDAGSSWTDRTLNWPAGGRWEALGRNWNTGTFIAGSSLGQWIRSTDNGTTWQSAGSPATGIDTWPGGGIAYDVLYDDANEIWVATGTQSTNPAIWTSDDDGLSWTQQTTGVGSPDSGTGTYRVGAKAQSTA